MALPAAGALEITDFRQDWVLALREEPFGGSAQQGQLLTKQRTT
jgi:hypothetical protein